MQKQPQRTDYRAKATNGRHFVLNVLSVQSYRAVLHLPFTFFDPRHTMPKGVICL